MKATVTKHTLTYARESHLKANELFQLFMSDASRRNLDGEFEMTLQTYKRLQRKYTTRARMCARRYHRKSKSIRRQMTTSDNWN